jgi:prevent-host-death family protein
VIDLTADIHSLTDFKRRTTDFVGQLKRTGHPLVLTVNGKAELVVQDAAAYQRLLELKERLEAIEGIRKGLEAVRRGQTRPAEEVFEEIHREYEVPH